MDVQYLTNEKGERTAVVVPIKEWEEIQEERNNLNSNIVYQDLKDAVEEMKLIKSGEKEARNAEMFLNEL